MGAGVKVACASALWGFVFVALAQLHVAPEKSVAPVVGATLWLLSCLALARTEPRGPVRRLIVATAASAVALLAGSLVELAADHTLVPELVAAAAFLVMLQCYAAAMAALHEGLHTDGLADGWRATERTFVAVDVASAAVAVAWAFDVVERRRVGDFRVTDLDLAPVGALGRAGLVVYAALLAVAAVYFVRSMWRTWSWARIAHDAAPAP